MAAVMFDRQEEVPPLPLPSLSGTCQGLLDAVRPLLTAEEHAVARDEAAQLCRAGGQGEALQRVLEGRAATRANWLGDWWERAAYLGYRAPVLLNSNPCRTIGSGARTALRLPPLPEGAGPAGPTGEHRRQQAVVAAHLLRQMLEYKMDVDARRLPPESAGRRPMCMKQHLSLLGSCRVPAEGEGDATGGGRVFCGCNGAGSGFPCRWPDRTACHTPPFLSPFLPHRAPMACQASMATRVSARSAERLSWPSRASSSLLTSTAPTAPPWPRSSFAIRSWGSRRRTLTQPTPRSAS